MTGVQGVEGVEGPNPSLRVRRFRGKGRGVVAARRFAQGELIERDLVVVIPPEEWSGLEGTVVSRYCFSWGARGNAAAIPMGTASFLNHSYAPNAMAQQSLRDGIIEFFALRDIEEGEEVTLNYNGDPDATDPMRFNVRD